MQSWWCMARDSRRSSTKYQARPAYKSSYKPRKRGRQLAGELVRKYSPDLAIAVISSMIGAGVFSFGSRLIAKGMRKEVAEATTGVAGFAEKPVGRGMYAERVHALRVISDREARIGNGPLLKEALMKSILGARSRSQLAKLTKDALSAL